MDGTPEMSQGVDEGSWKPEVIRERIEDLRREAEGENGFGVDHYFRTLIGEIVIWVDWEERLKENEAKKLLEEVVNKGKETNFGFLSGGKSYKREQIENEMKVEWKEYMNGALGGSVMSKWKKEDWSPFGEEKKNE